MRRVPEPAAVTRSELFRVLSVIESVFAFRVFLPALCPYHCSGESVVIDY